jgi:ribosomal biogenesis protein LAS1
MPSLAEVKRAARTALDWLWEWYWSQLDHAFGLTPSLPIVDADQDEGSIDRLHSILKAYVKARKQEIKAKRRADLCTSAATAWSTYTLRFTPGGTTLPSSTVQNALLQLLVNNTQILPQDKKLGSPMSGAFLVWSPLLRLFSANSPSFFPALLAQVQQQMNERDRSEEQREGLCEWAVHMLASRDWREARGSKERAMREEALTECMTELGRWHLRLAEGIVGAMDEEQAAMWRDVLDASRPAVGEGMVLDSDEMKEKTKETEDKMEVERTEELEKVVDAMPAEKTDQTRSPDTVEAGEKIKGPQKVVGTWKPKPIGWLPDGWDEDA